MAEKVTVGLTVKLPDLRFQLFTHVCKQTPSFPVDCSVPQGSVFGPVGFISYTEDVVDLMDRHHGPYVRSHIYADDTQYYDSCRLNEIDSLRSRLSRCASDIDHWCRSRRLQLNASKTEAIWYSGLAPSQTLRWARPTFPSKSDPRQSSHQLSSVISACTSP